MDWNFDLYRLIIFKTNTNYECENPGDCKDKNCSTNNWSLGFGKYFDTTTTGGNIDSSWNNDDGSDVNSYRYR